MKKIMAIAIIACSGMFMSAVGCAEAATYYVTDNFGTIQAAVDAAATGDTILVRPGAYLENVRIISKGVTLKSTDGPETTIIDGSGLSSTLYYSGYYENNVLDGFTVTNGYAGNGGGIYIYINRVVVGLNAFI